jgi:electron transfer flavoprotein beta subunit
LQIIVCLKQVPDTTEVKINPETNTLMREGVQSVINPFDMYALEEGLRIKESLGQGEVTVLSMGPPQVEDSLREALSLGADRAVLLSDRAFAGADSLATAYTLSRGVAKLGEFGLIICGKQAIDGDTAQVGPSLAEQLDIPHATYVRKVQSVDEEKMVVERMTEDGYEVIELAMPTLITVLKDINQPRLPSLKGKLRAKKAQIEIWGKEDLDVEEERLGLAGSPTQVVKIFTPQRARDCRVLEGTAEEMAKVLAQELKKII